jgi:hypothetical protein
MNTIQLNFINRSNDTNNSTVVIFQKNVARSPADTAVAWRVIGNCGHLDCHSFTYSPGYGVTARDSYGNYSPLWMTSGGQRLEVVKDEEWGYAIELSTRPANDPKEVMLLNGLMDGAIDVQCYRDEKMLAVETWVPPGQHAVFEFQPRIFVGVVSGIEEGAVMDAETVSGIHSDFDLTGVTSADIVMTGGGSGSASTPHRFSLENVRRS